MGRGCPKSRRARKSADNNNKNINNNTSKPTWDGSNNNSSQPSAQAILKVKSDGKTRVVTTTKPSSKSEEDLRLKLNAKWAAKHAPNDQVETTAQMHLPPYKEIEADEPQSQQLDGEGGSNDVEPNAEATSSLSSVTLMEIEPFSSPPNKRSISTKQQRYTRWDGSQAVILSPTVAVPSSPEPNGPETASISTAPPAAHLAVLCQIFNLPPKSEESETGDVLSSSVEQQFEVLAQQSRSVAGFDATCTSLFVHSTSISRAFYRERLLCTYTVPATVSFAFDVNASVAAPTSVPVKSARHRHFGGKASPFDADDDLDNIRLAERHCRKRRRLTEPIPSDDVDFCLAGSVVDPLLHFEDLPPLPSSPTLTTSEFALEVPSVSPSEEVNIEVLAEGYTPWPASFLPAA